MFESKITQKNLSFNIGACNIEHAANDLPVKNHTSKLPDSNLSTIIKKEYNDNITVKMGKDLIISKENNQSVSDNPKSETSYLKIKVIQKMLTKIICEKKLSEEQLANKLGIDGKSLLDLINGTGEQIIPKINLALVGLYCEIDFYDKYRSESNSFIFNYCNKKSIK